MSTALFTAAAFVAGVAADYVWVRWSAACNQRRAFHAANWSVAIYACGGVSTWALARGWWLPVIAFAVGGWLGTWAGVRHATE